MIKAVITDLDDTLFLTEAVCFEMENEVLTKLGLPLMTRETHLSSWGRPLYEALDVRAPGIDAETYRRAFIPTMEEYVRSGKIDSISAENLAALDRLIEWGKFVFILSSRTHEEIRHLLEPDHLLAERIKAFYHRGNMVHHKPDPRAFRKLLTDHHLSPSDCVYIGNSTGDAEAAKKAGLHFIASLESGLRTRADFSQYPVDAFVEAFPQITETIRQLERSA